VTRLHITFGNSAAATLRQALRQAGRNDEVAYLQDNFSFGPIAAPDPNVRARWVEYELGYSGWEFVIGATEPFLEETRVVDVPRVAWTSIRETSSYAGFLWWLSRVGDAPCSVVTVPAPGLLTADQMIALLGSEVVLGPGERARHQNRWQQLERENAPLRVIEGEELVSAQIDYFDPMLLSFATSNWQKMALIVGKALGEFYNGPYQTGDLVLAARLRALADDGQLEWRGDLSEIRACELRLPQAN
jgi:hypothetical protein